MSDLVLPVPKFLLGQFESYLVRSFRLLLITREQLDIAV